MEAQPTVIPSRRPPSERLAFFVDLEALPLQVLHHPTAELAAGILGHVLAHDFA
jgi:hypothetical protein